LRKIILSLHTSLDSFVADIKGNVDWINIDDEIFESVGLLTYYLYYYKPERRKK